MQEDLEYIKGHEDAINNEVAGEFFRTNPEKVRAITATEKESLLKKLDTLDGRFHLLIPYITNTRVYIKSITEKTKFSAAFLIFHKTIQTWEAMMMLARNGFYYETMELSRSTTENADLANLFILGDDDNKIITRWFNGEVILNRESRPSFEKVFNSNKFFPQDIPVAKTIGKIYSVMSEYTHGGYGPMLEMINMFSKNFDFDKSVGFHRLEEQTDVLKNLINKIQYSLILFYTSLVKDKEKADELIKLLPQPLETVNKEGIEKYYEKYKKS